MHHALKNAYKNKEELKIKGKWKKSLNDQMVNWATHYSAIRRSMIRRSAIRHSAIRHSAIRQAQYN